MPSNQEKFGPYNPWQPRVPKGVPEGGEWRPYRTTQVIFRGFKRGLRQGWNEATAKQHVANSILDLFGDLIPSNKAQEMAQELVQTFREEVAKVATRRPTALQVRARQMRVRREATKPESLGFAVSAPTARRIG